MPARAALPASVLVAALLAGCSSSDAAPKVLPPVTSSPSPTAQAVVSIPPAARARTAQGLEAFVRFYFRQLNTAFSASDPSPIRAYSDPLCGTCNNYIKALEAKPDELIRGETFRVREVLAPGPSAAETFVQVSGTLLDRMLVRRDGTVIEKLPGHRPFMFEVNVIRSGEAWRVRGIRLATQR